MKLNKLIEYPLISKLEDDLYYTYKKDFLFLWQKPFVLVQKSGINTLSSECFERNEFIAEIKKFFIGFN